MIACKPCEPQEEGTEDIAGEVDPLGLEGAELNDQPHIPHRGHGWVRVNDTKGCCPKIKWECQQDKCPKPKPCQQYYKLQELPVAKGECCPRFKCGKYSYSYNHNFLFLKVVLISWLYCVTISFYHPVVTT